MSKPKDFEDAYPRSPELKSNIKPPKAKQITSACQKNHANFTTLAFVSLALDFLNLAVFITGIILFNNPLPESQQLYRSKKIGQIISVFAINYIAGTFPFLLVYTPVSQYPDLSMSSTDLTCYILSWVELVLTFTSMNIKQWGKIQLSTDWQQNWVHRVFNLSVPSIDDNSKINQLINNGISVATQVVIFTFAIASSGINRLVLYLATPALFVGIFLISYSIQTALNKRLFLVFKTGKNLIEMTKIVTKNSIYFLLIGLFVSALIDGIASLWMFLGSWCAELGAKYSSVTLPLFDFQSASQIISVLTSFLLSFAAQFAVYLTSPVALYVQQTTDFQFNQNAFEIVKKQPVLFGRLIQTFIDVQRNVLISSTLIAGAILTSNFSDLIQLAFLWWSGALSTGGWSTVLRWVSFVTSWLMIGLYLFLVYKCYVNPRPWIGTLSFLLGLIAIPAFLSISLIRGFITELFPCNVQSMIDTLLTQYLIPFTALISLFQSAPIIFANCTPHRSFKANPHQYTRIDEIEAADTHRQNLKAITENGIPNPFTADAEEKKESVYDIDLEETFKAAKYVSSVSESCIPREKRRVFDATFEKRCKKLGILVEQQEREVFCGIRGTASLLDFGLDWILKAIPDWFQLTFGPIVDIQFDGNHSFVNWFVLHKARKIAALLKEIPDQYLDTPIVLSGHHLSASVAIVTAFLLHKNGTACKAYAFGLPHLLGQKLVSYVARQLPTHVIQVGDDAKFFLSGILTNQMSYDQTKLIAYAEMADNIFGYFAVLNAGTSTNKTLHAVRELIEDEARQTQHVTE